MLRFTQQPYEFKAARPNRLVYHLAMVANRFFILPGQKHRVKSMDVSGCDRLKKWIDDPDVRLVFVANHSTHSDVEILMEAQRRCGVWGAFMAAHEVFSRNALQSWVMQRVGAFSVNRENVDRQSIKEGVRVGKDKRHCLSLFPEGNVAFTNEKVHAFLDGASFLALKTQRALGDEAKVFVVPTAIRLTHTQDIRSLLKQQLRLLIEGLAEDGYVVEVDQHAPFYQQIEMVGYTILCRGLKRRDSQLPCDLATWRTDPDAALHQVAEAILSQLEGEMGIETHEAPGDHGERTRMVRSQLAKWRMAEGSGEDRDQECICQLDDQSILLLRVQTYAAGYLRDCPSLDRCSETLEKLREDFEEVLIRPVSDRHAHVHFGEPIEIAGKGLRDLTKELERSVAQHLSTYQSPYRGSGDAIISHLEPVS